MYVCFSVSDNHCWGKKEKAKDTEEEEERMDPSSCQAPWKHRLQQPVIHCQGNKIIAH